MKMLALDFSSAQRSVAVACGPSHVREVIESGPGNTMAPFGMIEYALALAGVKLGEIETIAVGLGPGSYAGIRTAIALALGWQLAERVGLMGIASSEAIATQAQMDGLHGNVNVVIDAQRGEFYLSKWHLTSQSRTETETFRIASADEIRLISAAGEVVTGPDISRWFPAGKVLYPRAAALTAIALDRPPESCNTLEPIYLRQTSFVKAPPPRVL
jgi:tRNA threonylcarbamoyladenosine biosynthesis protein TsaB